MFQNLPKQRRLDENEVQDFSPIIKTRPNKKIFQHHIQKTTGKYVTLRDISNLTAKVKPADPSFEQLMQQMIKDSSMLIETHTHMHPVQYNLVFHMQ